MLKLHGENLLYLFQFLLWNGVAYHASTCILSGKKETHFYTHHCRLAIIFNQQACAKPEGRYTLGMLYIVEASKDREKILKRRKDNLLFFKESERALPSHHVRQPLQHPHVRLYP